MALAPSVVAAQPAVERWPPLEGPDTPKLCLGLGDGGRAPEGQQDDGSRRIKQLGVDYVLGGGPRIPRQEADLRARIERLRAEGLTLYNLMIGGFRNTIYGRPCRDEEIESVIQSTSAADKAGLPVIEYNFYAHRERCHPAVELSRTENGENYYRCTLLTIVCRNWIIAGAVLRTV